jgi:hypothetical protein
MSTPSATTRGRRSAGVGVNSLTSLALTKKGGPNPTNGVNSVFSPPMNFGHLPRQPQDDFRDFRFEFVVGQIRKKADDALDLSIRHRLLDIARRFAVIKIQDFGRPPGDFRIRGTSCFAQRGRSRWAAQQSLMGRLTLFEVFAPQSFDEGFNRFAGGSSGNANGSTEEGRRNDFRHYLVPQHHVLVCPERVVIGVRVELAVANATATRQVHFRDDGRA